MLPKMRLGMSFLRKSAPGRSRRHEVEALACALLMILGGASIRSAQAGAWTQEQGTGLAILTIERVSADFRFEKDRSRRETSSFVKTEARLLLEYGLTERVTLRAKTAYEAWRRSDASADRGWGVQEFGGRVRLVERAGFVGSVEASLRVADAFEASPQFEYEGRVLAGYGTTVAGLPAFIDAQIGYRLQSEQARDEILLDLTAGLRPFERTLLLLQSFSTFATTSRFAHETAYDRHKGQASVVFDLTARWSLQLGGALTLVGSNVADESSAFGAVWLRF